MPTIRVTSNDPNEDQPVLGRNEPELDRDKDPAELQLPRRVVPSAWAARVIYERLRTTHEKRARGYARIEGMIDGNPPFPREALKRAGQLTNSNVNYRDGEATFESVALVFWSLFNDVQHLAEFEVEYGEPSSNKDMEGILAAEWDRLMRSWKDFAPVMAENQADFIKFGIGPLFWPDERDWRFEAVDVFRFLVPEKTRNSPEHINMVAIEHVMSIHELIDIVEHSNSPSWNKDVVKEVLVRKFMTDSTEKMQYSGQLYAELQRKIRNGDMLGDEQFNDDILLVSLYVREFSSEGEERVISRGIFDPVFAYPDDEWGRKRKSESDGWMFFKDRAYENFSQAFHFYTFTQGQKFLHGSKGLGHKIFNPIEGNTQIENSLMDAVRRASMILVKTKNTRNKGVSQINFVHGGVVDIGEAEFQENLMGSNFQASVSAVQYFDQKIQRNNNISGTSMSSPDGKPQTAAQTRMQATREARVQKNKISHYYGQTDFLFTEVFRKQLLSKEGHPGYEAVKDFKERCIQQGVPKDFFQVTKENAGPDGLPRHVKIRATRASGSGSQVADQIEMESIVKFLPTFGQRGRVNVIKDYIAAYKGYRYIPRYFPPEDQANEPMNDDTIASIENNQLEKGEMVVVSPDNKHPVHAPRHLERLKQIAEAYQKAEAAAKEAGSETPSKDAGQFGQYGLNETDVAFQTIGPHFVRHILYMSQDPINKSLVDSLRAQWAILANFGDKIANNAQEVREKEIRDIQKAQAEMENISIEERVGMAKVESDERVKLRKLLLEHNRAAQRDQLQYILQRQEVSFQHELEARKAEREAALEAKKSAEESTTGRAEGELY